MVSAWKGRWCWLVRDRSHAVNSLICIRRSCGAGTASRGWPNPAARISAVVSPRAGEATPPPMVAARSGLFRPVRGRAPTPAVLVIVMPDSL